MFIHKEKFMSWEAYSAKIVFLDQFSFQQDSMLKDIYFPFHAPSLFYCQKHL